MATRATRFRVIEPASLDARKTARHVVAIGRATVRQLTRDPADATLHDLSKFGCRLASPLDHETGERVWLRFKGSNPIASTVVWAEGGMVGCRFEAPIEGALVRSMILAVA